MKRLIIGQLPEDFDHHKDILLGPFCLIGQENLYNTWGKFNIEPDPFNTLEEMGHAASKTASYANYVLPFLCSHLNLLNNTNKSVDFWRILILPWLLLYIQVIWERYLRIEALIKKYSNQSLYIELVSDKNEWSFQNTLDFHYNGALNIFYNEWLFSRLIEEKSPPNWTLVYVDKKPEKQELPEEKFKQKIYDKFFLGLRCKDIPGINFFESLLFSLMLSLKKRSETRVNKTCEDGIHKPSGFDFLHEALYSYILNGMPVCFKNLQLDTINKIKGRRGKINIIGANYLYHKETYKQYIAHSVENGEKIIPSQHGGYYGTLKTHPLVSEVEYKFDSFINWGWEKHSQYTCNTIRLSSPLLSKFRRKKKRSSHIVFAGNSIYLLGTTFSSSPQSLQQLDYVKEKQSFLKTLNKDVLNKLYYRPHLSDHNSNDEFQFLSKQFSNIKLCSDKNKESVRKCKLLILDHPGTTLHFSMAANIPTICFWNIESWAVSEQAEPFFIAFKNAGFLFTNGHDAASKVNEIFEDVDKWWSQKEIQDARKSFCWNYARANKFWLFEWIGTLFKL